MDAEAPVLSFGGDGWAELSFGGEGRLNESVQVTATATTAPVHNSGFNRNAPVTLPVRGRNRPARAMDASRSLTVDSVSTAAADGAIMIASRNDTEPCAQHRSRR